MIQCGVSYDIVIGAEGLWLNGDPDCEGCVLLLGQANLPLEGAGGVFCMARRAVIGGVLAVQAGVAELLTVNTSLMFS